MRRYTENSSNLIDLELSCFQKLCFIGADADRGIFHALFQYSYLVGIGTATKGLCPRFSDTGRVFDRSRMFQHTARCSTVGIELTAVLFGCNGKADGILRHSDGTVTNKTVKTETGNMKNIGWFQNHGAAFHGRCIIRRKVVFVVKLPVFIPVYPHAVRHQRIQTDHFALSVADDLCVGIAPQEQMGHQRFPKHKGCHLRVWLVMEQKIKRMVKSLLFTAAFVVLINMDGQTCHRFGQYPYAGIDCRHLHGRAFIHTLSCRTVAHEKAVGTAGRSVGGSIPRPKDST